MTPSRFKEFEEIQRSLGALTARPLGVIQVPIDEIVGSVGRARYFPRGLRPGRGLTPSRVKRLIAALNHGEVLPAVLLYRIGHEYFVADGHHRIAAARLFGQQYVDAEVVAYLPEARRPEDIVARERVLFEQRTGITTIVLHEVGQYPKLLRWIKDDRRQRGRESPKSVSRDGSLRSAAREWYGRLYLPTIQDPAFRRLMRFFPGRSPGDVFVYVGDHKWIMSKAAGRDIGIPAAVASFEEHLRRGRGARGFTRWLEGLAGLVSRPSELAAGVTAPRQASDGRRAGE
jgi:Domain of unknown function (DUF4032)